MIMSESSAATQDTASYWQRTRHLGFALPRCLDCGRFHFYPRPGCPFCGSGRIAAAVASGRGSVYSHSTVYRAPGPAFADDVPYTIAIVALDEGPHLMTRIVETDPAHIRIGMRVRVDERADTAEPRFRPDASKEST